MVASVDVVKTEVVPLLGVTVDVSPSVVVMTDTVLVFASVVDGFVEDAVDTFIPEVVDGGIVAMLVVVVGTVLTVDFSVDWETVLVVKSEMLMYLSVLSPA